MLNLFVTNIITPTSTLLIFNIFTGEIFKLKLLLLVICFQIMEHTNIWAHIIHVRFIIIIIIIYLNIKFILN